jgi:uncharacterized protein YegJ (DUF2314 family)
MSTVITVLVIVAVLIAAYVAWWWFVGRNRPAFPPLSIADDDPLMEEAKRKARDSLERFRTFVTQYPDAGRVKIPFRTSGGELELLWAEVRKLRDRDVEVLYITPPVTHTGKLERIHTHPLTDVIDWIVTLPNGSYAGGFTMRVMFQRGREQWGSLPPALAAEERKYVEG